MTKITCQLLIFLAFCFNSVSVTANSMILGKYAWTDRLVILITNKKDTSLERQVKRFFENHACDIVDRKLNLLHFHSNGPAVTQLPKTMRAQTGLWLLGYDSSIKDFSEDGQLLNRLFQVIDRMPMRQDEMVSRPACS
ncbi:DUF4174 domain-containing protein [Candidatus Puniceispirillum sp.]|nr:DUF4174 domain-containing protein [Candidatus Puniceispirillum sp.]